MNHSSERTTCSVDHVHRTAVALFLALLLAALTMLVQAATPLSEAGYVGHSFGNAVSSEPTAKAGESKLWWHDGRWWAVLYNPDSGDYEIYWLDQNNQEWMETGVFVDEREHARADVLWDEQAQKLYIASHYKQSNPSQTGDMNKWGRLYRYSYNGSTYTLDNGFPVFVNQSVTEKLVLEKDSTGRLWVAFDSRQAGSNVYQIYANATDGNDQNWGTEFVLPVPGVTVIMDDIATVVAFEDDNGPQIGVIWSNQDDGNFYLATHPDGAGVQDGWALDNGFTAAIPYPSDDHLDVALTPTGQLLVVFKTETTIPTDPLIALVAREHNGDYSLHPVSAGNSQDTRPIVVVDEAANQAIVYMSTKSGGGQLCYNQTQITTPLADMNFPYDNCPPAAGELLPELLALADMPVFIGDANTYRNINDPTSTKQMFTKESGRVVLAADNQNGLVYVHNAVPTSMLDNVLYLPVLLK